MKAAILKRPGKIEVQDVEQPKLGEGEVLIKLDACGVCMTDYHMYKGSFPVKTPVILGHEATGRVVLSQIPEIKEGKRYVVDPLITCNTCSPCKKGQTNLCANTTAIGGAGDRVRDGAFAEYVNVPASNVEPIGDLPFRKAVFAEPLACCIHGVDKVNVSSGDTVAIIGAGPVGLLFVQLFLASGAGKVIASEPEPIRRRLATKFGADLTIDPTVQDPVSTIQNLTDEVNIAVEAVGKIETATQARKMISRGGKTLIFGVSPRDAVMEISPFDIYFREADLIGAYALTKNTLERSIYLLRSEKVNVEPLITEEYGLNGLPKAFNEMERHIGLKKLIIPAKN